MKIDITPTYNTIDINREDIQFFTFGTNNNQISLFFDSPEQLREFVAELEALVGHQD